MGACIGTRVGTCVGARVGTCVGTSVGALEVGWKVGFNVGDGVLCANIIHGDALNNPQTINHTDAATASPTRKRMFGWAKNTTQKMSASKISKLTPPRNIAFAGVGVMGASMVRHLLKAGYPVTVYNRSRAKAEVLGKEGAKVAGSIKELCQGNDCVFTMVGFPSDVREVYFGPEGILENCKENTLLVDFTTSKPSLAKEIEAAALARNLLCLDAPVSGGDVGARNAKLVIMCGGNTETFEYSKALLSHFGTPMHMGERAGSGQVSKMGNQITIAGNMIGLVEGMMYAKASGLSVDKYIECVSKGGAYSKSMEMYAPRILANDMEPGFYIKHFVKDLGIALEEAREMNLALPGLALANQLYIALQGHGEGDLGTQALIKAIARLSGKEYL